MDVSTAHLLEWSRSALRAVRVNGALYGTFNFSSPKPRPIPFTAIDKELLTLMAHWVSGALAG